MSSLEPPYTALDAGDMAGRIVRIPEQIEDALARAKEHPWAHVPRMPSSLAIGAMGGSAIAGELTSGLYDDRMPRPLLSVRGARWPASVTREAFALLVSYSGNTDETLALYREAGHRGVPRAGLTTGGALAVACDRDRVPWHKMPMGSPPRAAMYGVWVAITHLVAALDWVDDPGADWREAAAVLRERNATIGPTVPEASNPAKQLARALMGRMPMVYAGAERVGPLTTRLRHQLNENAKLLGHSAVVPELNHNEIVGWERESPAPVALVLLRDAEDTDDTSRRLSLTAEMAARQGATVHEIVSVGEGRLARLASLAQFGDYLSLYLAFARGVDPTPIASIDEFKRRLAGADQRSR